ncbi:hypothetical protein ARMGADRAFT_1036845 [Armillaria gallica]|uniref:Uncharacterized protein n=1 Tax=Armillaria gallica TaxID=47427 RepID=A0A2H3CU00_ARMGA|nr:hypothetical protein ARMGADRAFT_1036845 [Armillaria gallica]
MASPQASPNTQATVAADDAPLPCCETMTPSVVNDGWDLHMEWVYNSFTRSQLELMNDLVPDMIQAQRYHNDGTLRRFWAFVYHQFEDIYPARDWTEWTTEDDLRVAEMECHAIHFYMLMEGMHSQGLIRTGHDRFVENGATENITAGLAKYRLTLQNQAKSRTYYSRNRERILASLAEKYQGTKKLYVIPKLYEVLSDGLETRERMPKKRTDKQKRAHACNSVQSYQKNHEVILEWRRLARLATQSADSNKSTVSQPLRKKTPKEPPTCPQESVAVRPDSGNLSFWLRHSNTLEGRLATLLNRRIPAERNTGTQDLNDVQSYDCPKAQYVEHVYQEFHFLFRRDGTYDDGQDSVFEPRVEEMDALSTHAMHWADAILNIDGYGANYLKADGLAAEVTMVGGWIAELEIETINDPTELIKLHRKHQLMYQL